jgi:rhamnosyltransferase
MPKIVAIVVTYEPDQHLLSQLLLALSPQVAGGILINNGHHLPISDEVLEKEAFEVQHLQKNIGVASALNLGFQWAQAKNAEFVVTFDQDSKPAPDMVLKLFDAYQVQVAAGIKVGAVGAQQIDRRTGRHAYFLAPITGKRRKILPIEGETIEVDHLITSGCLVPVKVWGEAGFFLDALFIDYVDIEWCLRLRHCGWHFFGVGDALLNHSIGDNVKEWAGKTIPCHSPMRHYFMIRNGIYLQKLPYISFGWKIAEILQIIKKIILFSWTGHPRPAHIRAMWLGLCDGWHGRLGPKIR